MTENAHQFVVGDDSRQLETPSRVIRTVAPIKEQVVRLLRKAIANMELQPGQRLTERDVMARAQVSRSTAREAIQQLAAEELVTLVPQIGATITAPSQRMTTEIYEVRALLEGIVAGAFASQATDEEIASLRRALNNIIAHTQAKNIEATLHAKDDFDHILLHGAGHSVIAGILAGLSTRVAMLRVTTMRHPGRPEKAVKELEVLMRAIEARDPAAAAAAASDHVRNASATLGGVAMAGRPSSVTEQLKMGLPAPTNGSPSKRPSAAVGKKVGNNNHRRSH